MYCYLKIRDEIKAAYPGEKWSKKVNKMADNQVLAIWFRLKKEGKVA
jgi:hypothetical protein